MTTFHAPHDPWAPVHWAIGAFACIGRLFKYYLIAVFVFWVISLVVFAVTENVPGTALIAAGIIAIMARYFRPIRRK